MIKIINENEESRTSSRNIFTIIFAIVHIISIVGCIVGACLINRTNEVLIISVIICVIFTVLGAFVYEYDD